MRSNNKPRIFFSMALLMMFAMAMNAATIPAGTRVTVRMGQSLSSESAQPGQSFDATLANDVVVDGNTVAKAGAPVKGKVTSVKSSGRLKTPGAITVRLTSIDVNAVSTSSYGVKGKGHMKS